MPPVLQTANTSILSLKTSMNFKIIFLKIFLVIIFYFHLKRIVFLQNSRNNSKTKNVSEYGPRPLIYKLQFIILTNQIILHNYECCTYFQFINKIV